MHIHRGPRISWHKNNKRMCFCLCIWTPRASKVLCVFCARDVNSCFIPSAGAASDSPHSTGHPAVQLHCTRALQFVSKRFPKSQNISSAIQCAHHMQKRWGLKNWVGAWKPCGLAHRCHCVAVVLKINGYMLTRSDMLYKGRHLWSYDTSQTENTTSKPGKDVCCEWKHNNLSHRRYETLAALGLAPGTAETRQCENLAGWWWRNPRQGKS